MEENKQPTKPTTIASELSEQHVKKALAETFSVSYFGAAEESVAIEERKNFDDAVALLWDTQDAVIRRILQVVAQNIKAQGFRTKFTIPSGPFLNLKELYNYLGKEGVENIPKIYDNTEASLKGEFETSRAMGLCSSLTYKYGDPRRLIFICKADRGRKLYTVGELAATIIHEYTHFVLGVVYGNNYEPYPMGDKEVSQRERDFLVFFGIHSHLKDARSGALPDSYEHMLQEIEEDGELMTHSNVAFGKPLADAMKTCLLSWKEMFAGSQMVGARDETRPKKEMLPYFVEMYFHVVRYGLSFEWLENRLAKVGFNSLFTYITKPLYPDLDGELLIYSKGK
ncbi:hypothetical protein GP486_004815 [Trichoglossum hirsutum]|uniref:Uncharacterized protein n=1 Tax=Trichoglossum hirsutum TaxID=265104 RepID=A0A9P8LAF6_9PEZI|nr:hypothetical protein GP486_004815 [Trichoglossum hirsutum]